MMTAKRALSAGQGGQALVAVIVLIALLFMVGTAMTLAVSSSLQTVRQTTDEDWRGYAAESAVTRDLAKASVVIPPVNPNPPCTGLASLGGVVVNGFRMSAMRCAVGPLSGAPMGRNAIAAQKVAASSCAQPAVTFAAGRKVWGTIAWLPPGYNPNLQVVLDDSTACTGGGTTTNCSISASVSVGVAFFSCPDDDHNVLNLHVRVRGVSGARLSAFNVRSADDAGGDCVVTSIGVASGAIDEGDLLMPNCTNPPDTSVAFWNKLLP
jgi:hypothetical protein